MRERQATSLEYRRALETLERVRPDLIAPIRAYVAGLNSEAAGYRVRMNRLNSELAAALELVRGAR